MRPVIFVFENQAELTMKVNLEGPVPKVIVGHERIYEHTEFPADPAVLNEETLPNALRSFIKKINAVYETIDTEPIFKKAMEGFKRVQNA